MKLLAKTKKPKTKGLRVIEDDRNDSPVESTLNLKYLNDANAKYAANESTKKQLLDSMDILLVDRQTMEDKIVQKINSLSDEEKNNLGNHLRDIIRTILSEECKDLLVKQNNPVVNTPSNEITELNIAANKKDDIDSTFIESYFTSKEEFIKHLESFDKASLSIAFIYASNKNIVASKYGIQASSNIDETIIDSLSDIFGIQSIYVGKDEYVVYGISLDENDNTFFDNLNEFRKSIFAINTSNQFRFPIELNISDVEAIDYQSVSEAIMTAKRECIGLEEDALVTQEEKPSEVIVKNKEANNKPKEDTPTYKTIEIIDDYDEDTAITSDSITAFPGRRTYSEKDLGTFPRVIINANIKDKQLQSNIKVKLTVHLLYKSKLKQEILVSGSIDHEDILLISDYSDEKTTILISEQYGLILRFGSAIKAFIVKEKKNRFELWQEISRNVYENQPLTVDNMYVCPIAKDSNMAAFVCEINGKAKLLCTNEKGLLSVNGHNYRCSNTGTKFVVGID